MLTGYGCFGYYLNKFKIRASPECVNCQAPIDNEEHTTFACDRWWRERRRLEVNVGSDIGAESIVLPIMLQSKRNWLAVKKFVAKILVTKEEEERQAERRSMLNGL